MSAAVLSAAEKLSLAGFLIAQGDVEAYGRSAALFDVVGDIVARHVSAALEETESGCCGGCKWCLG